jgi:hypothetical protein
MAESTMKTVNIDIDPKDFKTLKDAGYKLCFAKMVNNTFNVVWQSAEDYLESNTFQWTPAYELFATNTFKDNITVRVATNKVNIGLGEGSTLDKEGHLEPATTQGPSTAITLINQYRPIHPGLNQLSTGIDGTQISTPIYVAPQPIVAGSDVLIPVDQVQVWFEQNIETSTMFSTARSNAVTIDLTNSDSGTRLYKDGAWSTPANPRLEESRGALLTIILTATASFTASMLALKIGAKLTGVYQNIKVDVSGSDKKFTVKYQEKTGLRAEEARYLETLKGMDTLRDQLVDFTTDALAALGSGFTTLSAA